MAMLSIDMDKLASDADTRNAGHVKTVQIELLRRRLAWLEGPDKAIMELYLERGGTFRQIAALAGVNEVTIARRIRKISDRLLNGRYLMVLRKREKFAETEIKVAKDYMINGSSQRQIAERHEISVYRVKKIIERIDRILSS